MSEAWLPSLLMRSGCLIVKIFFLRGCRLFSLACLEQFLYMYSRRGPGGLAWA